MNRQTASVSDELASLLQEVRAELASVASEVAESKLAITTLTSVLRELMAARRADREVLVKIFEACTREGDSKIADAIKHIEAGVGVLVEDMRVVRGAVVPTAATSPPA